MDAGHIPVLLHECIENLNIRPDGIYVDGTLGMGGHSEQIAGRLTSGTLVGIDRDETAIARAGARLAPFGDRVRLVHGNFRDTAAILDRPASTPWTACSSTSAFPRRSSTRRSAAFPICTTRRSTCAWTRPAA
ncbi:MAG: 16S rRNA (cytosine(1402)-N(4))-methyltransferase [Oscillospiraceae bacterium]